MVSRRWSVGNDLSSLSKPSISSLIFFDVSKLWLSCEVMPYSTASVDRMFNILARCRTFTSLTVVCLRIACTASTPRVWLTVFDIGQGLIPVTNQHNPYKMCPIRPGLSCRIGTACRSTTVNSLLFCCILTREVAPWAAAVCWLESIAAFHHTKS